ncbi:MAG TPA: ArsR family transcriptional regulator [Candidatus Nitrosotenuis sp.]|nr:ArsR family transcriptional regulator [Candidatus Nitrosotenuis sp.]
MSTHSQTQMSLFRIILEEGPLTLYAANIKSSSPIGTIHRHFREMVREKKIKIYTNLNDKSRGKIYYGPTLLGMVYFYRFDKTIQTRLDDYFLKWIGFDDFVAELREEGFITSNIAKSRDSKNLFRKYVHYFAGVENQIASLKEPDTIPREMLLYVGEFLLVRQPEYMKIWEELYHKMPSIKKNVDEYMQSTIEFYKKLKKTRIKN